MGRTKKTNTEVVQAEFPEFAAEADAMSSDKLTVRLAYLAKELEESETHKENNETLEQAKGDVAELSAPYKDLRKAVRLKSKYIIALLKEKGTL